MADANPHAGHRERLRARYEENGLSDFQDHELLELLLTFAIPRGNTNPTGHRLMEEFGSLSRVFQAEAKELARVEGVGERSALLIRLMGDVTRRLSRDSLSRSALPRLKNAEDAARYALNLTAGERYECSYVVCLDKNRRVLHGVRLTTGSLTEAPFYPRRVVEKALQLHAHGVMLVHNHPSGNPIPSPEDGEVTKAVNTALKCIDIQLYDHLITGRNAVYSFARDMVLRFTEKGMEAVTAGEFRESLVCAGPPNVRARAAEDSKNA